MICPHCQSPKTMAIPDSSAFLCYACKLEFTPEKPFASLRIFLSYGHDANEELVRRIKTDLEKRGHDVWFDKNEIKFGDNWRREITDGTLKSLRVLSFLSKHSTCDPGVCREEIAIALGVKGGNIQTILVESETKVQPPVNISHVQWLDMHDWRTAHGTVSAGKDGFASGDEPWEACYQTQLVEIIRVVESDESRRFAGGIETLAQHLNPIRSDARIYDLLRKGFFGRQWLFDAVEDWRLAKSEPRTKNEEPGTSPSRLFWITGDPGVGKSAYAAQLTHTRSDAIIAAQFVEWDKPDHRDARRVVRSLAFQLATRLPDWLGLVVTSRPESAVQTPLQGLNPFVLDTRTEANRADLRDYLQQKLAPQLHDRPDADRLLGQILEKSEGVFLYVERFCDDVQQNHLSLDRPEQFPQGLGGIFCQWFQRQFPDLKKFRKEVRPALRAILATCKRFLQGKSGTMLADVVNTQCSSLVVKHMIF
jgi:hypothetical protein